MSKPKVVSIAALLLLSACGQPGGSAGADMNMTVDTGDDEAAVQDPVGPNWKLSATGVLSEDDLMGWAKWVRDSQPTDQFSKKPSEAAAIGREFKIERPISSDNAGGAPLATWTYDAEKEVLHLESSLGYNADTTGYSIILKRDERNGPTKEMSNAFGATRDVSQRETWALGVGAERRTKLGVYPLNKDTSGSGDYWYNAVAKDLPMKPDVARATTQDMSLVIEGTVIEDKVDHTTVICTVNHHEPKIDSPEDLTEHRFTLRESLY